MNKRIIDIDFETRSECDIKECGAAVYAEHPSTKVLCLFFSVGQEKVQGILPNGWSWEEFKNLPEDHDFTSCVSYLEPEKVTQPDWVLNRLWERGYLVQAHNAFFEKQVWRNIMVKQFGWPDIPDNCWSCSAAKASALALPRALDKLGEAIDSSVKKDEDGKRVMLQLSKPRRPSKANPDLFFEIDKYPEKFYDLYSYCYDDVASERSIDEKLLPLTSMERSTWLLDQKINQRGVHIDVKTAQDAIHIIEEYEKECERRLVEITDGFLSNIRQLVKVKQYLESKGAIVPDLTAGTVSSLLEQEDLHYKARQVLEIRSNLSKTSTKKLAKMINVVTQDGTAKDILMYHGASTGRFSGKGVQLQNLARGAMAQYVEGGVAQDEEELIQDINKRSWKHLEAKYGDVMEPISTSLRSLIIAPPGKKFLAADYAAIEARVIMWLADQKDALETFYAQDKGEGEDIYKVMAGFIYDIDPSDVTKDQRQLGKQVVLGAGFSMSHNKFMITCQGYGMDVDEELAKKGIYGYRDKYYKVVELWDNLEKCAIEAVIKPGTKQTCGLISYVYDKDLNYLFAELPSGRRLAYYDAKVSMGETPWGEKKWQLSYMTVNSQTRKWNRTTAWRGIIVENVVQATARDLMVEAMLDLEEEGFEIAFTVHDELICGVPIDDDSFTVERMCDIMTRVPDWATGCPISAEGWEGNRYAKR